MGGTPKAWTLFQRDTTSHFTVSTAWKEHMPRQAGKILLERFVLFRVVALNFDKCLFLLGLGYVKECKPGKVYF